jgi:DNA-binding NarL/FixJ family response regulator
VVELGRAVGVATPLNRAIGDAWMRGELEVFDATVEPHHNFLANGVVAHNSLEQDADVVMFLYRDEVYNKESSDKAMAEVIIAKHRAGIAIVDMEAASISDVEHLSREFPKACIVCTHRLADEDMWTAAVSAGAADVCPPSDTRCILRAALRNASVAHSAAA